MAVDAVGRPFLRGERTLSRLLLAAGIGFAFVLAWLLVRFGGPKGNLFAPIGFLAALAVTPPKRIT